MIILRKKGSAGKTTECRTVAFATFVDTINACAIFGMRDSVMDKAKSGNNVYLPAANNLRQLTKGGTVGVDGWILKTLEYVDVDKVSGRYCTTIQYGSSAYLCDPTTALQHCKMNDGLSKMASVEFVKGQDKRECFAIVDSSDTILKVFIDGYKIVEGSALQAEGFPYISLGESGVNAPEGVRYQAAIEKALYKPLWDELEMIVKSRIIMRLDGYLIDSLTYEALSDNGAALSGGMGIRFARDLYSSNGKLSIGVYTPPMKNSDKDPLDSLNFTGFVYGLLSEENLSPNGYFTFDSKLAITSRFLGQRAYPGQLINGKPSRDIFYYLYDGETTYGRLFKYNHKTKTLSGYNRREAELDYKVSIAATTMSDEVVLRSLGGLARL